MKRRDFIKDTSVSALAVGTASHTFEPETFAKERSPISLPEAESKRSFWPEGGRLVVSISMLMEAGAQPLSGAESPMPKIEPPSSAASQPQAEANRVIRSKSLAVAQDAIPLFPLTDETKSRDHAIFLLTRSRSGDFAGYG